MEAKMNNVVQFANGKRENEGKKAAAEEKKKMSVDELMEKLRPAFEELEALGKKLEELKKQENELFDKRDALLSIKTAEAIATKAERIKWALAIRENEKSIVRVGEEMDEIKLNASLDVFNDMVLGVMNSWLFERFEGVVEGTLL